MEINEDSLKTWIPKLMKWNETYKNYENEMQVNVQNSNAPYMEFLENFNELNEYLQNLEKWLKLNGCSKALQEIPTVGKFLSQVCKSPFSHLNPVMNSSLISGMLVLSDILSPKQDCGNEVDSTIQQAKLWAVNHFSVSTSYFNEGVDMFLMEEFGVSQEEYLREHLNQAVEELSRSLIPSSNFKRYTQLMNDIIDVMEIVDLEMVIPIIENSLESLYSIPKNITNNINTDKYLSSLLKIFDKRLLSINAICNLLYLNYGIFEDLMSELIGDIINIFPAITEKLIVKKLIDKQIISIIKYDDRFYISTCQIIKSTISLIGIHPSLILLIKVLNKQKTSKLYVVDKDLEQLITLLQKNPNDIPLDQLEDSLQQILECCFNGSVKCKYEYAFKCWYALCTYYYWVDYSIIMLFYGTKQVMQKLVKLLLFFFNPINVGKIDENTAPIGSYVTNLSQMSNKKHIPFGDIQYLHSSLKNSLEEKYFINLIVIINIMFLMKVKVEDDLLEKLFIELIVGKGVDDSQKYWLLYSIELIQSSSRSIKSNKLFNVISETIFKDNRLLIEEFEKIFNKGI